MNNNSDISLCVPWNGNNVDIDEELNSVASINTKNLREFFQLRNQIKEQLTSEVNGSIDFGQCAQVKKNFLEEEIKGIDVSEKLHMEYISLLEMETKLKGELKEVEDNLKKCQQELDDCKEIKNDAKKFYKSKKTTLEVAKKMYDTSFGLEITISSEENSDCYTADVDFSGKNVKFTIDEKLNVITDFEALWLDPTKLDKVKMEFRKTHDGPLLLCTLKKLASSN